MEKYRYSEQEQALIENSEIPLGIYQFIDNSVQVIALSKGFCDLLGLSRDAAVNFMHNNMYKDTHPEDVARVAEEAYRFATTDVEYSTMYRVKIDGKYRIVRSHGKHIVKEDGSRLEMVWYSDEGPYLEAKTRGEDVFAREITRAIREKNMASALKYDYLTGLLSMTHFFELAEAARDRAFEKGETPVILFVDLTGMKLYNQKYGFAAGDKLIRSAAQKLVSYFSNENCSRFNADHFAVCTVDKNLDRKLKKVVEDFKDIAEGGGLPARIGVYRIPSKDIEISLACDRAKMACDSGRKGLVTNINYYDDAMMAKEERRHYIINNFEKALEEGWIKVHYQPIVRATSGKVCDEEALARWEDPEYGFIPPEEFVPILEEARIIHKLDLFVTGEIVKKIFVQQEHNINVCPMSVNLSRADFYNCDIVEEIRKILDDNGVDRSFLVVEVTESIVGSDVDYMARQIERFQQMGIKVWMDDYGSGYSSPEILQHIHFDTIKFDMEFMKEFHNGNESRIILTELIRMAIGLGIDTVAEGVEQEDQAEFLKEIGCSKLQGFYFCSPIPLSGVLERYDKGIQIGIENPSEIDYFDALGKESLYNMSISMNDDDEDEPLVDFFNTMPMAIFELSNTECWLVRANKSYKEFFYQNFKKEGNGIIKIADMLKGREKAFASALIQCKKDGQRMVLEETTEDGKIMHVFIRRIATNPVRDVAAFSVVLLDVIRKRNDDTGLTFSYIARTITADFIDLIYVDLDSGRFVEYGSGANNGTLNIEKRGEDFFAVAYEYAMKQIYEEDARLFTDEFKKEKIIKALDEDGSYVLCVRVKQEDGHPEYYNIKALRVKNKKNGMIIGISNVDAQKKHEQIMERIKEERVTYARIAALSGDYFIIFSVNPKDYKFIRYVLSQDIGGFGGNMRGENFFEYIRDFASKTIYPPDLRMFLDDFTRENVINSINNKGKYESKLRIVVDGEPVYVLVKAAMAREATGMRLIVGVNNIDEQTKLEESYKEKLLAAKNEAVTDALTGVKNKYAYDIEEERLDKLIKNGNVNNFAVVVLDVNGLKQVNDMYGHQAGDEFLIEASDIICDIFRHCPVYRVGGDEFVALVKGRSFKNLDKLMNLLEEQNQANSRSGDIVIAGGMSRYDGDKDMAAVFARADAAMYENKKRLKSLKIED
jgi:diguanylate cyclase (GGDEF)-like protein